MLLKWLYGKSTPEESLHILAITALYVEEEVFSDSASDLYLRREKITPSVRVRFNR